MIFLTSFYLKPHCYKKRWLNVITTINNDDNGLVISFIVLHFDMILAFWSHSVRDIFHEIPRNEETIAQLVSLRINWCLLFLLQFTYFFSLIFFSYLSFSFHLFLLLSFYYSINNRSLSILSAMSMHFLSFAFHLLSRSLFPFYHHAIVSLSSPNLSGQESII